ncbi:Zn-ribbon domain-containing OB-fold protein [Aromatoleum anaerobium]|uniref:DNA-binding protein n=1 Tax=Aromatoleum anaerobium TaxID=182180 RepID=A0ABX1PNG4_9RHOO|nr:Zn-ribbon domain-containing OB-fold protein [Aromatoleum anaerobium]MCK0508149.1 Zn-ribbon domain-containing OB-fold protein [Aromatoleum anaerobium]
MSEQRKPYDKPLPSHEGLHGAFYAWCRDRELRFQRCSGCGRFRHVPREICAHCSSIEWEWVRSSGRGTIYTWTEVARALHPAFADATPYAPVVVEMEEGVRMLSRVIDCAPDELAIGMPVEVEFVPVSDDVTLPFFRCAQG